MEFTFNNSWRTALRIARNARNAASRTTSAWPWLTSKPNLLSRNLRSPSGEPSFEELPIRGAWPVARHRSTNWDEVSILQKSILMEGRKSNQAINQSIIQSINQSIIHACMHSFIHQSIKLDMTMGLIYIHENGRMSYQELTHSWPWNRSSTTVFNSHLGGHPVAFQWLRNRANALGIVAHLRHHLGSKTKRKRTPNPSLAFFFDAGFFCWKNPWISIVPKNFMD